jgi:hypothetical protein
MKKLFLAVASMMVAHFAIKTWKKLNEKPPKTKEEIYRAMKAERERIRAQGAKTMAELDAFSTPSNGCAMGIARFS